MNATRIYGTLLAVAATFISTSVNAQDKQPWGQQAIGQQQQVKQFAQNQHETRVVPEALVIAPPEAPKLGFTGQAISGYGMKVLSVNAYSPAMNAGLESGDVILRINEFKINSLHDYRNALIDAANHHGGVVAMRVKNIRGNSYLGIPHFVDVTAYLPHIGPPVPAVAAAVTRN